MDPRDFGHLFRGFFGFPSHRSVEEPPSLKKPDDELGRQDPRDGNFFHFQVYTDPLEIHRFFEQQMNEMLRSFGQFGLPGQDSGPWGGVGRLPGAHTHEDDDSLESPSGYTGRDLMLRHDEPLAQRDRVDIDLDDREVSSEELISLLREERPTEHLPSPRNITPFGGLFGSSRGFLESFENPHIHTFGQSKKIIRRPDGSVETQETIRNYDGSETVVTKRTIGDQTHESRRTVGKEGEAPTTTETFSNLKETDMADFNRRWQAGGTDPLYRSEAGVDLFSPPGDRLFPSIFDRFFRS